MWLPLYICKARGWGELLQQFPLLSLHLAFLIEPHPKLYHCAGGRKRGWQHQWQARLHQSGHLQLQDSRCLPGRAGGPARPGEDARGSADKEGFDAG